MVGGIWNCPSSPISNQSGQYKFRQDVFVPYWNMAPPLGWNSSSVGPAIMNSIDKPAQKIAVWEAGAAPATQGLHGCGIQSNESPWAGWGNYTSDGSDLADGRGDRDFDCSWAGSSNRPRYRHNGYANVLYFDGHTKALRKGALNYCRDIYVGRNDENGPGSWSNWACPTY